MRRKELFYCVTSIRFKRDARCADYQQIGNGNIANQIHGFTIDSDNNNNNNNSLLADPLGGSSLLNYINYKIK